MTLTLITVAPGHQLASAPAASVARMVADGCPLEITEAWRSAETQAIRHAAWLAGTGAFALPPGESVHELGEAVDWRRAAATWVRAHPDHGWRFTNLSEWWHAEYRVALDTHLGRAPAPAPITPTEEDIDMWKHYVLAKLKTSPDVYMGDGITRRHIKTTAELADVQYRIERAGGDKVVQVVDRIDWLGKAI